MKKVIIAFFKSFFGILIVYNFLNNLFEFTKKNAVYRFYWGRGNTYKQAVHLTVFILTLLVVVSGLSHRLFGLNIGGLVQADVTLGNVDLLSQGSGIQTVLQFNPNLTFQVTEYTVVDGDNLQIIADKFNVTKDTIKWANLDKFGTYDAYNSEFVRANDKLKIPEVPGVLYSVKSDDTLDSVISKTSGDRNTVIEVNQLTAPNYSLADRTLVLVPNGHLPAPAAPVYVPAYTYRPPPAPGDCNINSSLPDLNGITFSNPVCHPSCAGYVETRGWLPWHDATDLAKFGGCPIRAACEGTVYYAGWGSGGEGYNVGIDCGNGVRTVYYHSDGNIWVTKGQHVSKGDDIMYMGCSGNCTGTHLHFGLKLNGQFIDPSSYVPY